MRINKHLLALYHRLYRKFNSRLVNKLIFAFSFIVFLILFMVISVSYLGTTKLLKNNYIQNSQRDLQHLSEGLENYVAQLDSFSLILRNDAQFVNVLLNTPETFENLTYIENQLKSVFYSRKDIADLSFHIPKNKKTYFLSTSSDKLHVKYDTAVETLSWYKATTQPLRFRTILPPEHMPETFLTFNRSIVNFADYPHSLGVISLTMNSLKEQELTKGLLNQNGEWIGIFDRNNAPYYESNPLFLQQSADDFIKQLQQHPSDGGYVWQLGSTEYLTIYHSSDNGDWQLVKLIPMHVLNKSAENMRTLSLLLGLFFLVLFIPLVMVVSNAITKPLKLLSQQMGKMGIANFDVLMTIRGNDEIAYLSRKFNLMVIKIKELINEEYKAKLSEKNARMKALEAQVNPHFLYNSLQAISTKALIHQKEDIYQMVEALAHTLRYSIKAGNIVQVSQEMEHVQNYMLLQKARFGDRLAMQVDLPSEIYEAIIPKLSIQTLVENAIKHALEQSLTAILITIQGRIEPGRIVISILDNGPGLSAERLQEVLHILNQAEWVNESHESMGLLNLDARLKLLIGKGARLEIISLAGQGAEARIILPK